MAAHTHWRITCDGLDYVQLAEVAFLSAGLTDLSVGGTASASSEYSAAYPASAAFDKNASGSWWCTATGSPLPAWLAYAHPTAVEPVYVRITAHPTYPPISPGLQHSGDGITWSAAVPLIFSSGGPIASGAATVFVPSVGSRPIVWQSNEVRELPAGDKLPADVIPLHGHAMGDVAGLDVALAGKADNSVPLTDAAGTATLPATTAEPVASRLQVLRNNIKQAFADLAGKADASHTHAQSDVTGLSTALAGKADDSAVVKLAGAQTVAGVKTFTSRTVHAGAYTASATPAHSATPTFDCATSNVFEPATLTGNVTSITLSNAAAGQTVQIRFQQDATGGRTVAVPSGAKVDGSINTAANRVSWLILTYSSRGARWEGNWLVIPS